MRPPHASSKAWRLIRFDIPVMQTLKDNYRATRTNLPDLYNEQRSEFAHAVFQSKFSPYNFQHFSELSQHMAADGQARLLKTQAYEASCH